MNLSLWVVNEVYESKKKMRPCSSLLCKEEDEVVDPVKGAKT
jgi:hypothetical protein